MKMSPKLYAREEATSKRPFCEKRNVSERVSIFRAGAGTHLTQTCILKAAGRSMARLFMNKSALGRPPKLGSPFNAASTF